MPPAGPHGGDGRELAAALGLGVGQRDLLDLSQSCNPFAPDPAPAVARQLTAGALGRYPDRLDQERAIAALGEVLGVAPGRLLVTNGGAEAIALVCAELGRGWVDEPDFSLYRRHLSVLDPTGPRLRSDPHNPTGLLAAAGEAAAVWDEAFYPLATGRWSAGRPAVTLGSLTKVLGCPGLRLGYVVVPPDDGGSIGLPGLRRRLAERQPRWSVGTAALGALPELLAEADPPAWAARIRQGRTELTRLLEAHGLRPRPSDANFVLVDGAAGLREALAPRGVVVRDCSSFGMPGVARVAVPDDDGLERLARALDQIDAAAASPAGRA